MTEVQKLNAEIAEFNAHRAADKTANSVTWEGPELKRGYTYRKTSLVRGLCRIK